MEYARFPDRRLIWLQFSIYNELKGFKLDGSFGVRSDPAYDGPCVRTLLRAMIVQGPRDSRYVGHLHGSDILGSQFHQLTHLERPRQAVNGDLGTLVKKACPRLLCTSKWQDKVTPELYHLKLECIFLSEDDDWFLADNPK
jgi:hypothetical protein